MMSSPALERGIRFKTNAVRGGVIENVFVRDVSIGETGAAIDIDLRYEEVAAGPFVPIVRNILVERLTVRQARYAFFVRGLPGAPVRGLVVRDSSFNEVSAGSVLEHVEDLLLHNVVIQPASVATTAEATPDENLPEASSQTRSPCPGEKGSVAARRWPR